MNYVGILLRVGIFCRYRCMSFQDDSCGTVIFQFGYSFPLLVKWMRICCAKFTQLTGWQCHRSADQQNTPANGNLIWIYARNIGNLIAALDGFRKFSTITADSRISRRKCCAAQISCGNFVYLPTEALRCDNSNARPILCPTARTCTCP